MVGTQTKRMRARHLPTIFRRLTDVRTNRSIETKGWIPTCRRSEGSGGWPTGGWPAAVFLRDSLSRIACAKDLVRGLEDALGRPLGECLALAP